MASGVQVGVRNFGEHQLSLWGQQFIGACLGDVVVSSPNPGLVPVGPEPEPKPAKGPGEPYSFRSRKQ